MRVALAADAWERIEQGRAVIDRLVDAGTPAYGITTGVGSQKDFAVDRAVIESYNSQLITAHATLAPGRQMPVPVVRAALAIQLNLFATGASGVRPVLVEALLKSLNDGPLPQVSEGASIGASDIVALAQMALRLIGRAPDQMDAAPLDRLAAKEALALMNSNAATLGAGAAVLAEAALLLRAADMAAALTLEGLRGNPNAWGAPIDAAVGRPGQAGVGTHLRALLADSALWQAGEARLLQDFLSLRCVPQIHGAAASAFAWATSIWQGELNGVVDNPLIDLASGAVLSHGNMETTLS
jgi:histidine ammonia-lyase